MDAGGETVGGLAWSPDGTELALGLLSGHVAAWKLGESTPRWTMKAHETAVVNLCFSPDGSILATRSEQELRAWRADGTRIETGSPLRSPGSEMAWSSSELLVTDSEGTTLRFWDTRTWSSLRNVQSFMDLPIHSLAASPDGRFLADGGAEGVRVFRVQGGEGGNRHLSQVYSSATLTDVLDIAWEHNSHRVALACENGNITILDVPDKKLVTVLEGHTLSVTSVSFSHDGRLLASISTDGNFKLWRTDTWEALPIQLKVTFGRGMSYRGLAFSPNGHALAIVSSGSQEVWLWELDAGSLFKDTAKSATVHEVSAKVVLVGEGRVGKSCLALRMVEDQYQELESTHGMRFWSLPVEQSASNTSASRTRREITLWDLGGQSEYQLVHQLFLKDSAVALMVMEPGRGDRAEEEIEGWNQRLLAQAGDRGIRKLLVGTKVDSSIAPVNHPALGALTKRLQIEQYVLTSAKTGQGISELKQALGKAIDWNAIEKSSRPELFQRIRQLIQRLREARRVVLSAIELEAELRRSLGSDFDAEAVRAVVGHLARQGLVADSRMADGKKVLILEVEQLERYAGSLIVAARENPHGVPAVDMARVLSPSMGFPRIRPEERLPRDQELPVLECVVELLIAHGVCLRHEGLLIFPSLFQPTQKEPDPGFSHSISLHYDFSGPIDNIYASLIASLAISRRFGPLRLWEDRAEFGRADKDSSGIRRVQSRGQSARGVAQLDVYFDNDTPESTRELFVSFIEEHLREQGVDLPEERLTITCVCGKVFLEEVVRKRLGDGKQDIGCEDCDRRTPITIGAHEARERNPELKQQLFALRTIIRETRSQILTEVKVSMTETMVKNTQEKPLHILHLSDLHVEAGDDPISLLQPLAEDLRDRKEGLGVDRLDYLVISGDITQQATPQEFDKARQFVSALIEQFGLAVQRCIMVPGNHDLDWNTPVYTWKNKRLVDVKRLPRDSYLEQGEGYLVREDTLYPNRFKNFSDHFYHPLFQKAYPLAPEEQCIPSLFSESRLQFLAINSAWQIDEYFRERSDISEKALSRGLLAASQELAKARERGDLADGERLLRLAVWHHPITGNEKIQSDAFMDLLRQADFRVCLHGHVHENRAELLNYLHSERRIHVVGAGSFGAHARERPESTPRLYNLLKLDRDLKRLEVHTRSRARVGGAWKGSAQWPVEGSQHQRPYYEVTLP